MWHWLKAWILEAQPSSRIARMKRLGRRYSAKEIADVKIITLLPLCDAKGLEDSQKRLAAALVNTRIRNIAITGPYGSGKSSFLRTYFHEHNVLWVSLAAFLNQDRDSSCGGVDTNKNAIHYVAYKKYESQKNTTKERQLELAILQQLLYSARASELPFSRFGRIHRIGFWRYLGVSITVIASLAWYFAASVRKMDIVALLESSNKSVASGETSLLIIIGVILSTIIVMWMCDIIKKFHIVFRFGAKPLDVEVAHQSTDSAFNKHIDELLYFFSVFKFDAVVFEDIDRFDDQLLFIKLREMNDLINGSRQVWRNKKPVRFVYAVRDNLLGSLDRVKFFDFILPIVPVMNALNSRVVFIQTLKLALDVSELSDQYHRFIRQMAKYIIDRRLLNNICNEFLTYKGRLDPKIPECNLLGLIMFKNLMPTEFALLYKGEGALVQVVAMIGEKRKSYYDESNKKLQGLRVRLDDLRANADFTLEDLNTLYLTKGLLRVIPPVAEGKNVFIKVNGNRYQLTTFLFPKNIPLLAKHEMELVQLGSYAIESPFATITWEQIESAVGGASYDERKLVVEGKKNLDMAELEKEISRISSDLPKIKSLSIRELIKRKQLSVDDVKLAVGDKGVDTSFIFSLLAGGYFTEQYKHLLCAFEDGVITKSDYDFEMAVYNGRSMAFDYKINKVAEVYEDIALPYFATKSILNFDLLRYILSTEAWASDKSDAFLSALFDDDIEYSFINQFTKLYIEHKQVASNLAPFLLRRGPDYYSRLVDVDEIGRDDKYLQIGNVLKKALRTKRNISLSEKLMDFIQETNNIDDMRMHMRMELEEFKIFVSRCDIEFASINFDGENGDYLYELLLEENAYQVNKRNVYALLIRNGVFVEQILTNCGSCILSCKDNRVATGCFRDIHAFLNQVYYSLPRAQDDTNDFVCFILNHEGMSLEACKKFLEHQLHGIEIVAMVKHFPVVIEAIRVNKVCPSWENLSVFYNMAFKNSNATTDLQIDAGNGSFLEMYLGNNAWHFSNSDCPNGLDGITDICSYLSTCKNLSDELVVRILRRCRKYFDQMKVNRSMSVGRVRLLAKWKLIVFSKDGYMELSASKSGASAEFAIMFAGNFVSAFGELPVSTEDMVAIVTDQRFSTENLIELCVKYEDRILSNKSVTDAVAQRIGVNDYHKYPIDIVCEGFEKLTPVAVQCAVLTGFDFDQSELLEMLRLMPGEFSKLAMPGTRPLIPKSKLIINLLEKLSEKGIVSSYSDENGNVRVNVKRNFSV